LHGVLVGDDEQPAFEANFGIISAYAEKLRVAAFAALEEASILVAVIKIYHAE